MAGLLSARTVGAGPAPRAHAPSRAPCVWPCARPCALAGQRARRFDVPCVGRPAAWIRRAGGCRRLNPRGWRNGPGGDSRLPDRARGPARPGAPRACGGATCGLGAPAVCSWCGRGAAAVRSRCRRGAASAWPQYGRRMAETDLWGGGNGTPNTACPRRVRLHVRPHGSLSHACLVAAWTPSHPGSRRPRPQR